MHGHDGQTVFRHLHWLISFQIIWHMLRAKLTVRVQRNSRSRGAPVHYRGFGLKSLSRRPPQNQHVAPQGIIKPDDETNNLQMKIRISKIDSFHQLRGWCPRSNKARLRIVEVVEVRRSVCMAIRCSLAPDPSNCPAKQYTEGGHIDIFYLSYSRALNFVPNWINISVADA